MAHVGDHDWIHITASGHLLDQRKAQWRYERAALGVVAQARG